MINEWKEEKEKEKERKIPHVQASHDIFIKSFLLFPSCFLSDCLLGISMMSPTYP